MPDGHERVVAVIGLGYVGLPLAVAFGKHTPTVGFDIDAARIGELRSGHDRTRQLLAQDLDSSSRLTLTSDEDALRGANFYVVTVPTPIDQSKRPDLGPLRAASELVSHYLSRGDIVVFESTVYPGATESVCVPILERGSGLTLNTDFFVGYSPERINPGDKSHSLATIVKVTSGSTPEAALAIDEMYSMIVDAGTHLAPSIQVAEAAKVIENVQRDVNIALMNELAVLFAKLGLDTHEVLEAASTKWNFLPFRPGLVGGHCIGVDPYYLTHRAQEVGHHPDVILAGRRVNDYMGTYVAERLVLLMCAAGIDVTRSHVLVLGLAFKENCPDMRNTRVVDVINALERFGAKVTVCDPLVSAADADEAYSLTLANLGEVRAQKFHAILHAVNHDLFAEELFPILGDILHPFGVTFDVKGTLPPFGAHGRL